MARTGVTQGRLPKPQTVVARSGLLTATVLSELAANVGDYILGCIYIAVLTLHARYEAVAGARQHADVCRGDGRACRDGEGPF